MPTGFVANATNAGDANDKPAHCDWRIIVGVVVSQSCLSALLRSASPRVLAALTATAAFAASGGWAVAEPASVIAARGAYAQAQPSATEPATPAAPASPAPAATPAKPADVTTLPPIEVRQTRRPARPQAVRRAPPVRPVARAPAPVAPSVAPPVNAFGDVGYHPGTATSATKTNTPLRDTPQSVTVITKQQVQDIGAQKIEDVARYAPGVNFHQGEGNRDQLVIRGASSTADFFVNGMRDDGQIFRDLYNSERIEFLKGPNAMVFGRGGGGGVLNRVLKEADGISINEWKLQTGSYSNARISADVGGKITDNLYGRINGVYEDTDTYRDFSYLRRGGINPTLTWFATPLTKVQVSYEYFHDERTADRGIPSFNGLPFPGAAPNQFFGNPALSYSPATQNVAYAKIDHDFNNGVTVRNQTRFADYKRFYQNVYPGSAVNNAGNYTLAAYNNTNDRQNLINQTDWTWRFNTDIWRHTLTFGTEVTNQRSANERFTGFFSNNSATSAPISASFPTSFQDVNFRGQASDGRNRTELNVLAAYVQDQIEFTRWLQFIGGARVERFDLDYVNLNAQTAGLFGQKFSQVNNVVSPRAGLVLKPIDPVSFYGSYAISYLPASGDQFGALTNITSALRPERFTNKEVGVKWDIQPLLTFSAAAFELDRENTPIRDASGTGIVVANGQSRVRGIEAGLAGSITDRWQISAGYAVLEARYVTDTSNGAGVLAARAGNHVPFVPTTTYSVWNKYDLTDMWGIGLGVIGQDRFYAAADNTVQVPGFTRVDGAVFWKLNKALRAQVNVENIFGAKYYPTADGNNNITIGSPRAARFVLTTNFAAWDQQGLGVPTWRQILGAEAVRGGT